MLTMKRMVALVAVAGFAGLLPAVSALATTASDRAAAIVVYPKIVVDTLTSTDTLIILSNASAFPVRAHCFLVNANGHCTNDTSPCRSSADCTPVGTCVPGWSELDFAVTLTPNQPFYWVAGVGRNQGCAQSGDCEQIPIPGGRGICLAPAIAAGFSCTSNADCGTPGGVCSSSVGSTNAGTSIPPAGEDPFVGELKCVEVGPDGTPATRGGIGANDLMGSATIISLTGPDTEPDAQSYNAIGIQTNQCEGGVRTGLPCSGAIDCPGGECVQTVNDDNILVLGGETPEYAGCPGQLVLDHIFDGSPDPIESEPNPLDLPGENTFLTDLTLVPCSEDFLLGSANIGRATAQFLVYNEFEQRFSTSRQVNCFDEVLLSNVDTRNNVRSIFSIGLSGTIAGQTRIRGVGAGLLGVARLMKGIFPPVIPVTPVVGYGAGYNLHQSGVRAAAGEEDIIVLP